MARAPATGRPLGRCFAPRFANHTDCAAACAALSTRHWRLTQACCKREPLRYKLGSESLIGRLSDDSDPTTGARDERYIHANPCTSASTPAWSDRPERLSH